MQRFLQGLNPLTRYFLFRLGIGLVMGVVLPMLLYAMLWFAYMPAFDNLLDEMGLYLLVGFLFWGGINWNLLYALSALAGLIYPFFFWGRQKQIIRKFFSGGAFSVVCKIVTMVLMIGVSLKITLYEISVTWPCYGYALKLPSPDKRYDIVVLRGDASAIDDFSYKVYLFPHALTPEQTPEGTQVKMIGIWRDKQYLVFSGYSLPMFRWSGTNAIEIDLDDVYNDVSEFHPVITPDTNTTILTSLVFGKSDSRNTMP